MAKFYYQLYALEADDIEAVRKRVEQMLGVEMHPHESISWGDYYMTEIDPDGLMISVYPNEDYEDGTPHEEEFADYPLLLSIYNSEDQPRQRQLILDDPELGAVEVESVPE